MYDRKRFAHLIGFESNSTATCACHFHFKGLDQPIFLFSWPFAFPGEVVFFFLAFHRNARVEQRVFTPLNAPFFQSWLYVCSSQPSCPTISLESSDPLSVFPHRSFLYLFVWNFFFSIFWRGKKESVAKYKCQYCRQLFELLIVYLEADDIPVG